MVTELMKQPQYQPLQVNEQALTLFAVQRGYYDDVPVEKALAFEAALRAYMKSKYGTLMDRMEQKKELAGDDEKELVNAIATASESRTSRSPRHLPRSIRTHREPSECRTVTREMFFSPGSGSGLTG